ncbi:MAG: FAD-binding oxidoreductase, partial [Thermoleophilaceae bacterium]|nr:FAD-binding oxidoreductase [Thermoleophilaceae bacterium]
MSAATIPYWLDEPYAPRPPLAGDVEVEACVIGAGVGGLSCARRLAQHGVETLVLERDTVAGGASGRNGGFLLAGLASFYMDARERHGPERARRLYARTLEAQKEIYALAAQLGVADAVRRTGLLRVSSSEEESEHVRRHVAALNADGFPGELLERDQLPPVLRKSAWNACLTEHDGALQPASWIRALARAAEAAGARIHE